jgi:hypothetical protein
VSPQAQCARKTKAPTGTKVKEKKHEIRNGDSAQGDEELVDGRPAVVFGANASDLRATTTGPETDGWSD